MHQLFMLGIAALTLIGAWLIAAGLVAAARRDRRLCVICRRAEAAPGTDECQRCWLDLN